MKRLLNKLSLPPFWGIAVLMASFFSDTPNMIIYSSLTLHLTYLFGVRPQNPNWRKFLIIAILLYSFVLIYHYFKTILDLEAGISLLTMLLSAKIFESKSIRDKAIYYYIGFLVITGVAIFNQSMISSIMCIILLSMGVWGHSSLRETGQFTIKFGGISNKNVIVYSFIASSILIICYLIFPRINFGFRNTSKLLGKSNFSPEARPGEVSQLVLSNEPVFVASFNNRVPASESLYWVGSILTRTNGYFWQQDMRGKGKTVTRFKGKRYRFEIQLRGQNNEFLFTPDSPLGPPDIMEPYRVIDEKSFKLNKSTHKKVTYGGFYSPTPQSMEPDPKIYRDHKKYSKASEQVRFLAGKLKGSNPQQTVSNTLNFFSEQGFIYSLNPGLTETLDDFLFNTKKGFCVHFASAMALLLRMNNIPSRVITGFHGGEYNEFGDFFTITGKDAHAWVEYHVDKKGWLRADPVSVIRPERISMGGQAFFSISATGEQLSEVSNHWLKTGFKMAGLYFDSINNKWQRFFYEYDQVKQFQLAKRMGLYLSQFYFYGGLLAGFLMMILILINSNFYKNRNLDSVNRELDKLIKAARKKNIIKSEFETPAHFFDRLKNTLGNEDSFLLDNLKDKYQRYQYGNEITGIKNIIQLLKITRNKLNAQ